MSDNGYLVWLIAMAIGTIFVLTIGTLAAADMLGPKRPEQRTENLAHHITEKTEQVEQVEQTAPAERAAAELVGQDAA